MALNFHPLAPACAALPLPLMAWSVRAGFPSPAEDHIEGRLDLNELLVTHPLATFLVRVKGQSMVLAGIQNDDYLIVNRALQAAHGSIVIALVDGDYTVKRLHKREGVFKLTAANDDFPAIEFVDGQVCEVWGVVTAVIKKF